MTKFHDFKLIVGKREFLWANHYTNKILYFVFVSTVELRTLYIQDLTYFYMTTIFECILNKIGPTHARTFTVQRKGIFNII